jgi:hypothetical protein
MAEFADGAPQAIDGAPVAANDDVRKYVIEIETYDRVSQKFRTRGQKILRRYRDERRQADEDQIKFNILWSNIQTLLPACYAKNPKPECERRFKDDDPIGRVASDILERSIAYFMDCGDFYDSARSAVLDRLLPGRGTMWVRYVPHFRDVDNDSDDSGPKEVKEEGPQISDSSDELEASDRPERDTSMIGSDPTDLDQDERVEVEYEEVACDYVHWEDFGHNIARTWDEVYLVWRRVFLDRDECIERFGDELGKRIPLDWSPKNLADEKITQEMKKACIYEMWDKRTKVAVWVHKSVPSFLDRRDDPLKLEKFFPCPKPLIATTANDSILPTADYSEYQDQARELDQLTARISSVIRSLKVCGVYASGVQGIDRLLSEGTENQLIPVEQWALFAEKGGLKGVFELWPLGDIVAALTSMYEAREKIKADLYEVSGMPDIIRGANDPRATATAEKIKGAYGSIRLRAVQDEVQRFMRDMIRLMGEVIANHISWPTLSQICGIKLLSKREKDAYMVMAKAPGEPLPPVIQKLLTEPSWEEVEALLRNNAMRQFRLDIETDSTIGDDNEVQQAQRLEFLKVMAPMIQQAVQAGETNPTMVPLMIESIKWVVRSFPQARSLEGIIDQTLDILSKQPPPPKQNPEMLKVQGEQQIQQIRAQTDLQIEQGKAAVQERLEQIKAQVQIQVAQAEQEAQAQQAAQENELEARRDQLKAQNEMAIAQYKIDKEVEKAITIARIDAEKAIAVARIGSKAFPSDGTADLIYQQAHETSVNQGDHGMVSGAQDMTHTMERPEPDGDNDASV